MLSGWYILWIVVTQAVNLAFYLAVTKSVCGRTRTIGAYVVGYLLPLAVCLELLDPGLHGGEQGTEGALRYGFAVFFALWSVVTLALSRGSFGRRLFAVLVCGVHQLGAFVFCLLIMRHVLPVSLGGALACAVMLLMGVALIYKGIPAVFGMDDVAGWRGLNVTAAMNFALLYATGIWPIYAPTREWEHVAVFLVANLVAIVYFPVARLSAEKNREAHLRKLLEENTRALKAEFATMKASEDGARRVRHDARHHVQMLSSMLEAGQIDAARSYLEHTFAHELLLPPMNARWCENEIVNTILSISKSRATSRGFEFEAEARVPSILRFSDIDLVALSANLIENAINGCGGGVVKVSIVEDRGALRIGVSNRVKSGFELYEGLPCAKTGVGIFSVRSIVEKYHGLFDYELSDGVLTARVMIGGRG